MQTESRMESRKKRTPIRAGGVIALIFVAVVLLAFIGAGGYTWYVLDRNTIYSGVMINNIDLGQMTMEQATKKINDSNESVLQTINFNLIYNDKKWSFSAKDIRVAFNTPDIMAKAYAIGRKRSIWERMMEIRKVEANKVKFETSYTYDITPLQPKVEKIATEVSFLPIDATVTFQPEKADKFTFTEEKTGLGMNAQDAMKSLQKMMEKKDFGSRNIATEVLQSKVKVADLKKNTSLVSTFTTTMSSNAPRTHNISLATGAFNGKVVLPGEIFSMNKTTGIRSKEKGYQDAPAIKNGKEYVDEPGGGVCQASGTLYNAVMMSDLKIVERLHHSWPSLYVPIGRDATINYPTADFQFKNNRTTPIYMARTINGNKLTVEIYGAPLLEGQQIEVYSELVSSTPPPAPLIKIDPTFPAGKKEEIIQPRIGYRSKTYKVYYDANGMKIKTIQVSEDVYKPVRGEYRVGPDTLVPVPTPSASPVAAA